MNLGDTPRPPSKRLLLSVLAVFQRPANHLIPNPVGDQAGNEALEALR